MAIVSVHPCTPKLVGIHIVSIFMKIYRNLVSSKRKRKEKEKGKREKGKGKITL